MDSQTKNKMKAKYYEMFDGRIDKEVIDMVLQTCDYQDEQVYQNLIELAGDALEAPPQRNSSSRQDARAAHMHNTHHLYDFVQVDSPRHFNPESSNLSYNHGSSSRRGSQPFEREIISKPHETDLSVTQDKNEAVNNLLVLGDKSYSFDIGSASVNPTSASTFDITNLPPLPIPRDSQKDSIPSLFQTSNRTRETKAKEKFYLPDHTLDRYEASSDRARETKSVKQNFYSPDPTLFRYESFQKPPVTQPEPSVRLFGGLDMSQAVKSKTPSNPTQDDKGCLYRDEAFLWLVLMRGLPGCGKSTKAKMLNGGKGQIFSTDDYFIDRSGRYNFNPNKLSDAHTWNQRRARRAMTDRISPIFIDNTNIEAWTMKQYVVDALNNGYLIDVVEPDTDWAWDPNVLARKNHHGVKAEAIQRMKDKYDHKVTAESLTHMAKKSAQHSSAKKQSANSTSTQVLYKDQDNDYEQHQQQQQHVQQRQILSSPYFRNQQHDHTQQQQKSETNLTTLPSNVNSFTMDQNRSQPTRLNYSELYSQGTTHGSLFGERDYGTLYDRQSGSVFDSQRSATLPLNLGNSNHQFARIPQKSSSSDLFKVESPKLALPSKANEDSLLYSGGYEKLTAPGTTGAASASPLSAPVEPLNYHQLSEKLEQYKVDSNPSSPLPATREAEYQPESGDLAHRTEPENKGSSTVLVKNSSGTTLTAKQVKLREILHNEFSHVDKDALDQLLESCSYNYEAASNFVRCSAPPPTSKQKTELKRKDPQTPTTPTKAASHKKSSTATPPTTSVKKDKTASSSSTSITDQPGFVHVNMPGPSNSVDYFVEPPQISRSVNKAYDERTVGLDTVNQISSGKIGNIVESYKSVKSKLDAIEVSSDSSDSPSPPSGSSYANELNAFMEFNLQFLYECFPTYPRKYCQKWLKLYNGDVVKACDYLARRSQADELPADVMSVDSDDDDDDNDDGDYEMISNDEEDEGNGITSLTSAMDVGTKIADIDPMPASAGGLFLCDDNNKSSETVTMAIDKSLGMELKKRFGGNKDFSEDELENDDFVFDLNKEIATLLYKAWSTSIKERKRKRDDIDEDERFARKLQDEEDKSSSQDKTDGRSKKKKAKGTKMNIAYTRDELTNLQADRKVNPWSPWKNNNENQVTSIEGFSGKKLTKKQMDARESLHQMFPGVNEESLDQILESTSYNIDAASKLVTQSTGAERNTDGLDESSGWKLVTSPPRKKHNESNTPGGIASSGTASQPPVIAGFQTFSDDNQSYSDLRAEAQIHANLRTEYFNKAAEAFRSKNGQLAQYYADKAHDHTKQMKDAHFRAAEMTLQRRNKNYLKEQRIIDLHGLHAEEAVRALRNFLRNAVKIGHREVEIITGRGNHSKNGISTVRNAILNYLNQNHYKFELRNNGGSVNIRL